MMCVAIPVKITKKISASKCQVKGGKMVDLTMVPQAKAGDWLLCHADLAVNIVSAAEAEQILKLNHKCSHQKEKK